MDMSRLKIGDRVLECVKWTPNIEMMQRKKKLGEGVVTLIVADAEEERKMRIVWNAGVLTWHLERDLVNIERVVRYTDGNDD